MGSEYAPDLDGRRGPPVRSPSRPPPFERTRHEDRARARHPASARLGVRLPPAPARPRSPARPGPALGRTLRSDPADLRAPDKAAHVYYVAPDGRAEAAGDDAGRAHDPRGGDRAGRDRRRDRDARRHVPHRRPAAQPGDHPAAVRATSGRSSRGRAWRPSGRPCAATCGGRPGRRSSRRSPLGWWQRDREGMRTPLHRFNNDMVFVDGELLKSAGWEGELDEHSFYIDYEAGHVYIGTDPTNRLVEITAFDGALVRTTAPVHGKTNDRKGPADPRDHVHAVRLARARGRGQAQLRPDRGADRRAARTRRPRDVRQGGHGHDARERDDLLLLARRPATSAATASSSATR